MGILGSALGAAGAVYGGIKASKAAREVRKNIERQKRDNENWFNARYNEDATQRADAQRILTRTMDALRQRNQNIAGASAVNGASAEAVAAEKAASTKAIADATSAIAEGAEHRKDAIEGTYLNTKANLNDQQNQNTMRKAQAIADATAQVGQFAAAMDADPAASPITINMPGQGVKNKV